MAKKECHEPSQFVKLAGSIGGILLVVVIMFLIFAQAFIVYLIPIAWAFVVLGCVLGFFQYQAMKPRKK